MFCLIIVAILNHVDFIRCCRSFNNFQRVSLISIYWYREYFTNRQIFPRTFFLLPLGNKLTVIWWNQGQTQALKAAQVICHTSTGGALLYGETWPVVSASLTGIGSTHLFDVEGHRLDVCSVCQYSSLHLSRSTFTFGKHKKCAHSFTLQQ